MSNRFIHAFIALSLLGTGCSVSARGGAAPSATPLLATVTLPVVRTVLPAATSTALSAQPTSAPVDGATSTQVNVRTEPSTASPVLGVIPAETRVEIVGKDPGGNWWQIRYPHPDAPNGTGWVTAQYVITAGTPDVPTVGGEETAAGNIAVIQQQLNVRSGPGTGFNSLGTLNPQDVVRLTGKDPDGSWLQIEFPQGAGPEDKGWVNAAFVQAQGAENLPIIAESGEVVGTGTPTGIPATPTPTRIPARQDGDSASSPSANLVFEPAGARAYFYNGEISAPEGDREDWIAFRPYEEFIFASLDCEGSSALEMEIIADAAPLGKPIRCNEPEKQIMLTPGSFYLAHLYISPSAQTLQYTNYILTLKMRP